VTSPTNKFNAVPIEKVFEGWPIRTGLLSNRRHTGQRLRWSTSAHRIPRIHGSRGSRSPVPRPVRGFRCFRGIWRAGSMKPATKPVQSWG